MSRAEAEELLNGRMDTAIHFLEKPNTEKMDLDRRRSEYRLWDDYNRDLLRKMFTDDTRAEEYEEERRPYVIEGPKPLSSEVKEYVEDVKRKVYCLLSIRNRLPLYSESGLPVQAASCERLRQYGSTVFLVHGHDTGTRDSVARFVDKLKLSVMILSEQANEGRTIIEKFEDCCQDAGFAVVIMTPDDVGSSNSETKMLPRARQNVILELGYFMAYLGRSRVAVLYKEDVELPSDIHGFVYLPLDVNGAWKSRLARELIHAGLPVDLAGAISI